MTDIVERLRACQGVLTHDPECNCAEAAAELERRTALHEAAAARAELAQIEIEQLRVAAEDAMDILEVMDVHIDDPFYRRVIRTMKRLSHALKPKP